MAGGNIHGGKQLGKDRKQLSIFVSNELFEKILESAKRRESSISDVARIALKEYFTRQSEN